MKTALKLEKSLQKEMNLYFKEQQKKIKKFKKSVKNYKSSEE